MSENESKQKYFPLKPKTEEGFKEPVSWFGGREFISSLKGIIIYSIYGESIDPRPWMKSKPYPAATEGGVLGIDSENQKLDFRQRAFFKQVLKDCKPKKIIVSTPEPTTVFGRKCDPLDKTAAYVTAITESIGLKQPF